MPSVSALARSGIVCILDTPCPASATSARVLSRTRSGAAEKLTRTDSDGGSWVGMAVSSSRTRTSPSSTRVIVDQSRAPHSDEKNRAYQVPFYVSLASLPTEFPSSQLDILASRRQNSKVPST